MTNSSSSALMPDRHPQLDFFICNLSDISSRGDQASMEHPVFSLKPIHESRHYEHEGNMIDIHPGKFGSATVHDRDILIYCISQCKEALNKRKNIFKNVRFTARSLLIASNRPTNDVGYERLVSALDRLTGTYIKTNIKNGKHTITEGFHLLEKYRIIRENEKGRMIEVEVTLPVWIYDAIQHNHVLKIHPHYFRLRKAIERRIYELVRKHCGTKKTKWTISLSKLSKKVGSQGSLKKFKNKVSQIIDQDAEENYFPEYGFCFENSDDTDPIVRFYPKTELLEKQKRGSGPKEIHLNARTIEKGKKFVPAGTDIYAVKAEWEEFVHKKGIKIKNKEALFIDFCKKWTHNRQMKLPLE